MRFVILFLLIIPFHGLSQELNFSLTNGIGQHKEELLQPIFYSGYRVGFGVEFNQKLENNHLFFADFFTSGIITAKTKLGNDMSQLNINLELGYLFDTKFNYWKTGVGLQAQYDYALYALNYEYPFWFTQYSLNWHNRLDLPLRENVKLSVFLSIPVVGLFSRTEKEVLYDQKRDYTRAYFHRDMNAGSFNDFQAVSSSVFLSKNINQKIGVRIGYRGSYFRYKKPYPVSSIYHSLLLAINLKL